MVWVPTRLFIQKQTRKVRGNVGRSSPLRVSRLPHILLGMPGTQGYESKAVADPHLADILDF